MAEVNTFKTVCEQLDIDMDLMESDPAAFIQIVHRKAMDLGAELKHKNSLQDIETSFKAEARRNAEAMDRAQEIFDKIMDLVSDEEPEVIANLLPRMAEITQVANNQVRSMAIRKNTRGFLNKKQLHLLYVSLKKTYDAYVDFMKMFGKIERAPMIPAITGNYGAESSSVRTFLVYVDGEELISPYIAARRLGLEITHYMDMIEIIDNSDGTIAGKNVHYKEV